MRQCRFCGHINDDALIYCISCDSPMDPTMQSRIPDELRKAIEDNKKGVQSSEPGTSSASKHQASTSPSMQVAAAEHASTSPSMQVAAAEHASTSPSMQAHANRNPRSQHHVSTSHLFESAKPFTDPGQSYEMTSVPVFSQGEMPFFSEEDRHNLNPVVPTQIQSMPQRQDDDTLPLKSQANADYIPVSPTAAINPFQNASQLSSSANSDPQRVAPLSASSADVGPSLSASAARVPSTLPETRSITSPRISPAKSSPKLPAESYELEDQHSESLAGGWRLLSSLLMVLLMLISGGFIAVFVYMYLFTGDNNLSSQKTKASSKKWNPIAARKIPQPRVPRKPASRRKDPTKRFRLLLAKAKADLRQRDWKSANKKVSMVLASKAGKPLYPQANRLRSQILAEAHSADALRLSKRYARQRRWSRSARSLRKIHPGTFADKSAGRVRRLLERRYLRRRVRWTRRYTRRRQYSRAYKIYRSVLKTSPRYSYARRRYKRLSKYVQRRCRRCKRWCRRRYRRRRRSVRRRRAWCLRRCQRRYPEPPQLLASSAPPPVATASTPRPAPTRKVRAQASQSKTCRKCKYRMRRLQRCQKRYRRRFRYWCRRRCYRLRRYRRSRRRKKRCLRRCKRNRYTRIIRRRCRSYQRRYTRCKRQCP